MTMPTTHFGSNACNERDKMGGCDNYFRYNHKTAKQSCISTRYIENYLRSLQFPISIPVGTAATL